MRTPAVNHFRLYGRLGMTGWRMKVWEEGVPNASDLSLSGEAGLEWQAGANFLLRLGYHHVDDGASATTVGLAIALRPGDWRGWDRLW
jgi:hypothetical protein